jgi:hypothetical protein
MPQSLTVPHLRPEIPNLTKSLVPQGPYGYVLAAGIPVNYDGTFSNPWRPPGRWVGLGADRVLASRPRPGRPRAAPVPLHLQQIANDPGHPLDRAGGSRHRPPGGHRPGPGKATRPDGQAKAPGVHTQHDQLMTDERTGRRTHPHQSSAGNRGRICPGRHSGSSLGGRLRGDLQRDRRHSRLLTDGQLATVTPACAAWTVRELVAHMPGPLSSPIVTSLVLTDTRRGP